MSLIAVSRLEFLARVVTEFENAARLAEGVTPADQVRIMRLLGTGWGLALGNVHGERADDLARAFVEGLFNPGDEVEVGPEA